MIVTEQQIDLVAEIVERHVHEALETGDDLRDTAVYAVHAVRQVRVCAGGGDWLLTCHAGAGACPSCPGQVRLRAAGPLMPSGSRLVSRGLLRPKTGAHQSIDISVFAAAVVVLPARGVRPGCWHA